MNNKILITGGAGYIGSHTIIEILETTDFDIISIDNYSNSSEKTYERIENITGKKIKYYNCDLCNLMETEIVFKNEANIKGIIHFAAFKSVPESVSNPHKYYHNNINSLLNVLTLASKYDINNFIFSSSCSVYGNIEKMPVTEDTPLQKAVSPYAFTKQIGERIVEDFCFSTVNFNAISLRYFNPAGAHKSGLNGENPKNSPTSLTPLIVLTACGMVEKLIVHGNDFNTKDGTCIRDFIHVMDIAKAHVLALKNIFNNTQKLQYDVINLGNGEGISVLEAINSFEKSTGQKLNYEFGPRREGDVEAIYADTYKSKKVLSWHPEYTLEEIMSSAWEWENNMKKEAEK